MTVDDGILYSDRYSEDEQLSVRPFFAKNEKYELDWRLIFKINILFYSDIS
jgi:hypothetical protein